MGVVGACLLLQPMFISTGSASALTVTRVGRWNLDENPTGPNSALHDQVANHDGWTASNWSGSSAEPLAPTGTGAISFPGWTQLTTSNRVDPTASSLTIPSRSIFNPEDREFTVSVWVKALDPEPLLRTGIVQPEDTFNIVQKGLAPGQQWKMSVDARGRFICTFRGPDGSGKTRRFKVVSDIYGFGVVRKLSCSLAGGIIESRVITEGVTDVYIAAGPSGVENSDRITVGKKPGSVDPGDTFAGVLDDLVISKGASGG